MTQDSHSGNKNKTVLIVLAVVFAFPVFSCCICGPLLAVLGTSDRERANDLWEEGKKAEAAEIYADVVEYGAGSSDAVILERLITHSYENGDKQQAKHYCRVAAENGQELALSPADLQNLYLREKKAYEVEQAKPKGFAAQVLPASERQVEAIASGLQKDFKYYPSEAFTVKAASYKNAYYVVMPISGPGIPKTLGAWFRYGGPNEDGMVFSADVPASVFSVFPKGSDTKANAWQDDKDCDLLLHYVSEKTGCSW